MTTEFMPRKLPKTREYPGYQFYAILSCRDGSADDCFRLAALTVTDWLKERMEHSETTPAELRALPPREQYQRIASEELHSFRVSAGFAADVTVLPEQGIWTLRLKEPDSDTRDRKALPGRLFTTNIAIRIMNEVQVEFAVRIDVTDPEGAAEIDFAFRPKCVRYLFRTEGLSITQTGRLPYEQAVPVDSEDSFRSLRQVLDSTQGLMPVILFTQAIRIPALSAGPSPLPGVLFPGDMPVLPHRDDPPTVPGLFFPFSADNFAAHAFGYGITCTVTESLHAALAKRLHRDYSPGDVLFVEPKRFGGNIHVFDGKKADTPARAQAKAHQYSRNKNYSFGNTIFEYDARGIEQQRQINAVIRSDQIRDNEKVERLQAIIAELRQENENQIRKIDELKQQNLNEFSRGEEAAYAENLALEQECERLEKENHTLQANNERLSAENEEARSFRDAAEAFRSMEEMPQTNEDVVNYFTRVFGHRIVFTEKGRKTACRCGIRPAGLWYYLYHMAKELYGIHAANIPDVETWFMNATGIEVALGEQSQTRNNSKLMRLREDVYNGKTISVEPHVKLNAQRAGADHQRIYYCYDHELDLIIIGHAGDHLRTYGSLFID